MGWGLVLGINDTSLFCGPLCSLPGHIFRFFVSCAGPEEIVPVGTRGKRRKTKNKKKIKKPAKKKKSREIWWNVPKKSLSAIREKKFFCERNPTGLWKQKITNKVRDLIIYVQITTHSSNCLYINSGHHGGRHLAGVTRRKTAKAVMKPFMCEDG